MRAPQNLRLLCRQYSTAGTSLPNKCFSTLPGYLRHYEVIQQELMFNDQQLFGVHLYVSPVTLA